MPFTFAHPAAVIPLQRPLGRFGVLSALVIGSLAPDLPYFLPLPVDRAESHSVAGLFWLCLPLGFLAYLAFHLVLKRPLLALLPARVAGRLAPLVCTRSFLPQAPWTSVFVSLVIGGFTHLVWDSFTHEGSPAVKALPFLRADLFAVGEYHIHLFQVLQHVSSVAGLALLTWWSWRWLRRTPPHPLRPPLPVLSARGKAAVLSSLLVLSGSFALLPVVDVVLEPTGITALRDALREAVSGSISALALCGFAYSVAWHVWVWCSQRCART